MGFGMGKGWARQGHPLSTAEILFGHTAGMRCHGHCRDTVGYVTAGIQARDCCIPCDATAGCTATSGMSKGGTGGWPL